MFLGLGNNGGSVYSNVQKLEIWTQLKIHQVEKLTQGFGKKLKKLIRAVLLQTSELLNQPIVYKHNLCAVAVRLAAATKGCAWSLLLWCWSHYIQKWQHRIQIRLKHQCRNQLPDSKYSLSDCE